MRELPPESLLRVLHSDRPAEPPFAVYGYPRDQVLAIQKQAYEDGLRDAADFPTDALTVNLVRIVGMNKHLARECELVVRAMLTALQEKK